MACGDVLSLEDLQTAKKHQIFEAEVITGKVGGVSTGVSIDYATNQVTGQTQKTLPAIMRDIGFEPASFDFTTGGTLTTADRNKAVLWPLASGGDGDWYYWEGALPKVVPAASTPASTGGAVEGAWRPVGDISLRGELVLPGGVALVGGATREVRTSQYAGFGAALDAALSLDATLVVDNVQNITTTYRRSLAGKNFKILYEGAGIINYTGPQDESTYRVLLTLDGTGVETVTTATRINGNKVRGVGAPIVGIIVNNVHAHYEGCYAENLSAVVNTVTAKLHVCYGARYENIPQQLLTQAFPGVYGYGTVPIDCDLVVVFGNRLGQRRHL